MRRTVSPSRIDGALPAPPSKSVMIRVTAAALLAGGSMTRIRNPSHCVDALSGLEVATGLGAAVSVSPDEVVIRGGLRRVERELSCGESGLSLRMFAAIAALLDEEVVLTGRPALLRRPVPSITGPLTALGAQCRTRGGHPPVTVRGPLRGGEVTVDGAVTSQFLTGLLLALPCAAGDSVVRATNLASRPYVDLTLDLLARWGVQVEQDEPDRFSIAGGQRPEIRDFTVEGDWSAAAILLVLGAVGGRIRVTGLDPSSCQADRQILLPLVDAGAKVTTLDDGVEVERDGLSAFDFDVTDAPDLLPPLAALACHCEGRSVLRNVGRLVHKESSRAEAMARELTRLGVAMELDGETLTICGGPVAGGTVGAHGDHRIAMALAAAALPARGPVTIDGAEHVEKTYPRFFEDLRSIGGEVLDPAEGAAP